MKYFDRVFPIKQGTACVNKWTWSTLWLTNGTTASCHRVHPHHVPLEDFATFHNTPEKIQQREQMLQGQWPQEGCQYCGDIEAAGGKSDRMYYNNDVIGWTPKEIFEQTDSVPLRVTPRVVEIFINNTCNLKCIYCDPILSSSIQRENAQWGSFWNPKNGRHLLLRDDPDTVISSRTDYVDAFFTWLADNHQEIARLHILGGEPFLQPELNRLIEFFDNHASPGLDVNIVSNLMIKERNLRNYVDQFGLLVQQGKLARLHVTGSIDAWGPGAEYVRNGLKLETFENNLRYIMQSPQTNDVGLYQVMTVLGVKEAVPLYEKILEWRQQFPRLKYHFQMNTDVSKLFLNPGHWGSELWRGDFEKLLDLMYHNREEHADEMLGIWQRIQATQPDAEQRELCAIYLDELDRRRGTDWRSLFPYLEI